MQLESNSKLCPSSQLQEGVMLLGIVQGDRTVTLLGTPLLVDEHFVAKATETGSPESRFRFANTCAKGGCKQWNGTHCTVIDTLAELNKNAAPPDELKPCIIRNRCRWYYQEGAKACGLCTYVVTDNIEEVGREVKELLMVE